MNELITPGQAMPPAEPTHRALPPHILAFEQVLAETYHDVTEFRRQSDGLIGPIGLDAMLGMVPILGGLYSSYGAFKLLGSAARAKCSSSTRFTGFVLAGLDVVIGVVVGVGDIVDAFFRSHAIYASHILDEIRAKLIAIETARQAGHQQGFLTQGEITRLEDTLFRGGKTQSAMKIRGFVVLDVLGLLLFSCVG